MWKIAAAVGGVLTAGIIFVLWCLLKAGSDEDDFWCIDHEFSEGEFTDEKE
jgi:hypothetical protein